MLIDFAYGKENVSLDLPEKNLLSVLKPNDCQSACSLSEAEEIIRSLDHPIGTDLLENIVNPGETVAIITSDITRPVPSYKIIPHIVDRLLRKGIREEDILVVFALGSHRPHTADEMRSLVGDEVYTKVRCMDSIDRFVYIGSSSRGTPYEIFEPVVRADRRILVGNIEFHYFAGYSGGAKAIMPGVSTRNAISANHSRMVQPAAKAGAMDDNPVRLDIEEVADYISIDFIVNVVLDEKKHIVKSVAGHHVTAHREGCAFLDGLYRVDIPKKADIVIVSPGGYPKDINLYQAQKALDNAKHAVRDGGIVIWLASAKEGFGEHVFENWMLGHEKASDMIPHIEKDFQLGGHKAAAIAMVLESARIFLVSDLPDETVLRCHLEPKESLTSAFSDALEILGREASVIAMPFAGSTLPFVNQN